MYQVGFGDCFLFSFRYARKLPDGRHERHMLVDFGSSRAPVAWGGKVSERLSAVADSIRTVTGGRLDVLVATHRHKDHVSGFADANVAAVIEALAPAHVVRPWTDDPTEPADATTPGAVFRQHLAHADAIATAVAQASIDDQRFAPLLPAVELQLSNQQALSMLDTLAAKRSVAYVSAGSDAGIVAHIPGISVEVLGPPTIDQWPSITQARADDPNEFWIVPPSLGVEAAPDGLPHQSAGGAVRAAPIDPRRHPDRVQGQARWLVERLRKRNLGEVEGIVTSVDAALNNTSVILLVKVGERTILLPGDAQIESWAYTLLNPANPRRAELAAMLGAVDLYKVGHHGSRNATPKTLVNLWQSAPARHRTSLMSTMSGVHGSTAVTAVPSAKLDLALPRLFTTFTTDGLDDVTPFIAVTTKTDTDAPWVPMTG